MVTKTLVKPNAYHDSVTLMTVSSAVDALPGVETASVVMGTALNLEQLRDSGLAPTEDVGPNDLVVAVRAASEDQADAALAEAEARLTRRPTGAGADSEARRPRTLRRALEARPDLNLAAISVPGSFASIEAEEALRAGLHVFLFSDNVPLAEEVRLKRLAGEMGLLLMGPDCGTAIVNGVGLGFANVVRRGPIGVIGASGTGLQQITCLIDRLGGGVSQAIGTGGRDLRAEVGGMTMRAAIAALGADEATRVLVLVSKPPADAVARSVLDAAAATGKPTVAVFLGGDPAADAPPGVTLVRTLTDAARWAVAATGGNGEAAATDTIDARQPGRTLDERGPEQRYVRGLFSGGTLCEEALLLLAERLGPVFSNVPFDPRWALADAHQSREHTLVDLGSDELTIGRPHPMIDPTLRNERIARESADPTTVCLLLDVVLGYGAHPDPAGALAPVIQQCRALAEAEGRQLPIVVSLCGTEGDPQCFSRQEAALREAGALVYGSNAAAALAVAAIVEGR
ncbi:MAG: acyl-CoA synthetase FdrA [Chloroflexi bacterium]|nr:acyl-CoA synthetase FdrA [Chloroflexota bacterium]